ncbi:hypothetical protein GDO78_002372 [Eleutherodactylus coqui]|uniref:Uncharacterized protein n=1 Tax=Eleutherodactylus coqui TaxID=57060 RepID=A0A8J6EXT3_ELECQ|nr:hypothetical protein GDO78_002372 [Eleutherodactylus coqui]
MGVLTTGKIILRSDGCYPAFQNLINGSPLSRTSSNPHHSRFNVYLCILSANRIVLGGFFIASIHISGTRPQYSKWPLLKK